MTGAGEARAGDVESTERALRSWLADAQYASYDPYDALTAAFPWSLARRNRLAARVLTQIVKTSPVNLRPALGIGKRVLSKTWSDLASAALLRRRMGDRPATGEAAAFFARLHAELVPGYSGACWALATPYVTRFTNSRGGDGNVFWTINAAVAYLESYELDGRDADLAVARSAIEFIRNDLGIVDEGADGVWLRYFAGQDACVYNVAALGGALFRRVAHYTGEEELAALGTRALRFVIQHQNADGSWNYARGPQGAWVDGFHTGYVLEALLQAALWDGDPVTRAALDRGAAFYRRALFDPDDVPRYSTASRFPVDVQNCAQAIQTLSRLAWIDPSALEHAERVTQAVCRQLWIPAPSGGSERGWFAAWRGKLAVNRVPLVRWGQAPMVLALDSLLAARHGLRPSWERTPAT